MTISVVNAFGQEADSCCRGQIKIAISVSNDNIHRASSKTGHFRFNATGKVLVIDIAAKPIPHSVDSLTGRWLKLYYYLLLKQAH